jgi:hypothetical protein
MIDIQKLRRAHERAVQARKDYLASTASHGCDPFIEYTQAQLALAERAITDLPFLFAEAEKAARLREAAKKLADWVDEVDPATPGLAEVRAALMP